MVTKKEGSVALSKKPGLKPRDVLRVILHNSVWIVLIIFVAVNLFLTPRFATALNMRNILINSSVLGIVVIAESICLLSGHFDLSVESTLALAAVVGALLLRTGIPVYVAIMTLLSVGCFVGLCNGLLIRKIGLNAFVATLITYIGVRGVALGIVEGKTIWNLPESFCYIGAGTVGGVPVQIIIFLLLYGLFHFILTSTTFGRHVYLVGDSQLAAWTAGINVDRVVVSVFVLSGLLSAFAGWMMAGRVNSATPHFGTGMVFEAMAAAIIGGISLRGGIGSLPMALGGVLLLTCISNVLNLHAVSPYWIQAIRGAMILFAVFLDSLKRKLMRYAE
ncbi:MAG: ABC transporter permease [Candidatus Bathyarchaeia archaeon]